jgi:tetratricopeptide (TPR) repeat protein
LGQTLSTLENPAVMARWHVAVGRVYTTQANRAEAAAEFATAYRLATEAGDDELAAATLVMQLTVVTNDTSADAVKQLEDHARAAVDRVGSPFWTSQLRRAIATQAMVAGSLELAAREFRAAIEELRPLRVQPHQMELSMMQNLGAVLLESGDPSGAEAVLAEAVGDAKLRWAPHEPELYWALRSAHATAQLAAGKVAAAADVFAEVASGLESIGAAPIQRGMVQSYRSAALVSLKRMDEARTAAEQAVELVAVDAGESSVLVWPLLAAGQVALGQSDWTAGRQHLLRAQSICKRGSCRDIEVLVLKAYLAIALKRTGDGRAGLRLAREVVTQLEQPGFEQASRDVAEAFPALSNQ